MRVMPGTMDIATREREEMWRASALMDQGRRRRELDALRYQYHAGQAERLKRTMSQLVEHHLHEAQKLLERKES